MNFNKHIVYNYLKCVYIFGTCCVYIYIYIHILGNPVHICIYIFSDTLHIYIYVLGHPIYIYTFLETKIFGTPCICTFFQRFVGNVWSFL